MKTKVFVLSLCIAGVFMACNRGEEKSNPEVQDTKTSVQFVGVADDGSFDKILLKGPMKPETFKELNDSLGINLDDIVPNTIEVFTYSAENYNRDYSLTMNLRSLGHCSYFVLKPNGGKPATMGVMRVPFGSELGKMAVDIFTAKKDIYSTTDKADFNNWVNSKINGGMVVVSTYDKRIDVYTATTYTSEEWDEKYGSAESANKVNYYDCTK